MIAFQRHVKGFAEYDELAQKKSNYLHAKVKDQHRIYSPLSTLPWPYS